MNLLPQGNTTVFGGRTFQSRGNSIWIQPACATNIFRFFYSKKYVV